MSVYYIRKTGSDSNAGTSAGAAWLTLGKALGAAGIASGDTVYVGAGIYREVVVIAMTSAVAETFIIGDMDGAQTGDAGEVIWSAYLSGDKSAPSGSSNLTLQGRDFLTFQNITFIRGSTRTINATSTTSTNITFSNCTFIDINSASNTIGLTIAFGVAANWTIDSCRFFAAGTPIAITVTTGAGSDYDVNIQVLNCLFLVSSGAAISIAASGTSSQEGNGIDVLNCTFFGAAIATTGSRVSLTYPSSVSNSFIFSASATAISAGESGAITEQDNIICAATPRTNVTAGSRSISDLSYHPLLDIGQAIALGGSPRPFLSPERISPLMGFCATTPPGDDILNQPRPAGTIFKGDTGTATAGAAETLTDSGKTWGTNYWSGWTIKIISGTGSGQTKLIDTNTATVLTVHGNWKTNPSTDSVYMIYQGAPSSSGTATAGSTTTLTDSNANWPTNSWAGYTLEIDSGTGSPQSLVVVSNTATVLTFATATAPDNTSTYKLYRGTNENTINAAVGCYELGDTAVKETGTVRTGSNSIRIQGVGTQDFNIPVDTTSTTVSVYVRWDAAYTGTKPLMKVLNGTECGVADATDTAVGSADTWEELSLNFTPTSKGVVTIRLQSSTTTPTGTMFADDLTVT